jgi:hypothetical protein
MHACLFRFGDSGLGRGWRGERGKRGVGAHLSHNQAVRVDESKLVAVALRVDVHCAAIQFKQVAGVVLILPRLQNARVPAPTPKNFSSSAHEGPTRARM